MKKVFTLTVILFAVVLISGSVYAEDGIYRPTAEVPMSAQMLKIQEKLERLESMMKELIAEQKALQSQMEKEHQQIRVWVNRR